MPAITMREIVITAAAAVCAFVTALVFVLRMSSRRRRLAAMAAQPQTRRQPALGRKILVVRPR